jgi:hypothetical protein
MARRLRILHEHALYRVINRGNHGPDLFPLQVPRALALRGGRAIWLDCSGVECGKRGDLAQRRLAFSSDCIMQRPDPLSEFFLGIEVRTDRKADAAMRKTWFAEIAATLG